MYSVIRVKPKGEGFTADLISNGKLVASVTDRGNGECYQVDWVDKQAPLVHSKVRDYDDSLLDVVVTPFEAVFNAYVLSLPRVPADGLFTEGHYFNGEEVIAGLIDNYLLAGSRSHS